MKKAVAIIIGILCAALVVAYIYFFISTFVMVITGDSSLSFQYVRNRIVTIVVVTAVMGVAGSAFKVLLLLFGLKEGKRHSKIKYY